MCSGEIQLWPLTMHDHFPGWDQYVLVLTIPWDTILKFKIYSLFLTNNLLFRSIWFYSFDGLHEDNQDIREFQIFVYTEVIDDNFGFSILPSVNLARLMSWKQRCELKGAANAISAIVDAGLNWGFLGSFLLEVR